MDELNKELWEKEVGEDQSGFSNSKQNITKTLQYSTVPNVNTEQLWSIPSMYNRASAQQIFSYNPDIKQNKERNKQYRTPALLTVISCLVESWLWNLDRLCLHDPWCHPQLKLTDNFFYCWAVEKRA